MASARSALCADEFFRGGDGDAVSWAAPGRLTNRCRSPAWTCIRDTAYRLWVLLGFRRSRWWASLSTCCTNATHPCHEVSGRACARTFLIERKRRAAKSRTAAKRKPAKKRSQAPISWRRWRRHLSRPSSASSRTSRGCRSRFGLLVPLSPLGPSTSSHRNCIGNNQRAASTTGRPDRQRDGDHCTPGTPFGRSPSRPCRGGVFGTPDATPTGRVCLSAT